MLQNICQRHKSKKVFKALISSFSLSNKIFFKSLRVYFNVTKRNFFQSQFSRRYSKHFSSKASAHSKFYLALVFIPPNPIMMCCSLTSNKQRVSTLAWDFFRENCWSIIWKSLCLTRFADVAVSVANFQNSNSLLWYWSNLNFPANKHQITWKWHISKYS